MQKFSYLNNNNIEKPKLKNIKNINTKDKKISDFIENTILPKKNGIKNLKTYGTLEKNKQ